MLQQESFFHKKYSTKPATISRWEICSNAVVVLQESTMVVYMHARHQACLRRQAIVASTSGDVEARARDYLMLEKLDNCIRCSNGFVLGALLCAIVYGNLSDPSKQQNRKTKARQRMVDSCLLAVLLRYFAAVLRTLTASFSSDTVESLAVASMVLHLIACDYSFANGYSTSVALDTTRPSFGGGTLAINCALFATTLLVSRLESNIQAYMFLSMGVALFAFYSATRHAIASSFPPHESGALWIITGLLVGGVVCLVGDDHLLAKLAVGAILLIFVIPVWKYNAQYHKVLIHGPWTVPNVVPRRHN